MFRRGIDHLVLAVKDLDSAAELYRQLGFQVGARNRHPWGTENRIVQFPASFLELITVADPSAVPPHRPGHFSFGAFVTEFLSNREGLAMIALGSADAARDTAQFASSGIGPFDTFSFEREGWQPDGTVIRVAFSLAFAHDPAAPGVGFFVCQHHHPENFWSERFQSHQNGATGLHSVTMVSPAPNQHERFLAVFTNAEACALGSGLSFSLARERIDVITPDDAAALLGSINAPEAKPALAAYSVAVPDLAFQARRLTAAEIPFSQGPGRLVVPASAARGVAVVFVSP
ncbi:VOC family protein [Microvirga massiliensis]|uniref:VOC family protein n=1 Tax=Microvirga massiliensis TaxID=1033741 RepID=UPI00062B3881|nr:VOC family protein [Microvirga massiliensis]